MNTMYHIKSIIKIKQFILVVLSLNEIQCSIDGTFYKRRPNDTKPGDDPCNPLYWYPQNIPEYCNYRSTPIPTPPGPELPIPIPIPVPVPPPLPIPLPIVPPPMVPPIMMPPSVMPPGPLPPFAIPQPIMPLPMPLPFGIPLAPTNPMVPVAGIPVAPPPQPIYPMPYPPSYPMPYPSNYGSQFPSPFPSPYPAPYPPHMPSPYPSPYPMQPQRGIGMVPGIPGIVSPDGGINILPFSDAYSDMLEMHKQKMIRRRLQKLFNEYDSSPWKSHRKTRRQNGKESKLEDNTIA